MRDNWIFIQIRIIGAAVGSMMERWPGNATGGERRLGFIRPASPFYIPRPGTKE